MNMDNKRFSFTKLLGLIFTRAFFFILLISLQIYFIFIFTLNVFPFSSQLYFVFQLINFLFSLYLISSKDNPAYKLGWLFVIFIIPPTGALIYLYSRWRQLPHKKPRRYTLLNQRLRAKLTPQDEVGLKLAHLSPSVRSQFYYLSQSGAALAYTNTQSKYFSCGEDYFTDLLQQLKLAKKYIFLEYFIIREGKMWSEILSILTTKAKSGVQVRILYDDLGSILLPNNFPKKMAQVGIEAKCFNRLRPFLQTKVNNRDHRKIVVIDGVTSYLGGINLADEYINVIHPYGHWKDMAVRLKGEASWSVTVLFLQMWNATFQSDLDFNYFLPPKTKFEDDGIVQPFGSEPQGNEYVSASVYFNLITKAKNKIVITSPYLVLNHELLTALCLAAKNGIEVIIVVPSHYDKWYVRLLSQAFYVNLLEAGVKIYEYLPGFIHGKTILVDDEIGVVGSINLDFRSLFLLFEAGVLMYKTAALKQLQTDLDNIITESSLVPLSRVNEVRWHTHVVRSILRLVAPLF